MFTLSEIIIIITIIIQDKYIENLLMFVYTECNNIMYCQNIQINK